MKTLHQLYTGKISPGKTTTPRSKEYMAARGDYVQHLQALRDALEAQSTDLLTQFLSLEDEMRSLHATEQEYMFYQGFSLASKLLAEAIYMRKLY